MVHVKFSHFKKLQKLFDPRNKNCKFVIANMNHLPLTFSNSYIMLVYLFANQFDSFLSLLLLNSLDVPMNCVPM